METLYFPEDPRHYVKQEFDSRVKRRPHYSLRAFARDLEVSPSTLSDFMKGRLGFSRERTAFIAKKLQLNNEQRDHWWDLMESKHARKTDARKLARTRSVARSSESKMKMALEQFQFVSDWQHLAILELVDVGPRYHSAEAIAKALGLTVKVARESVERLEKLEMISTAGKAWKVNSAVTHVGEGVPSRAIQIFHQQILQKMTSALEKQPVEKREFQSLIFGMKSADVPRFKEDLAQAVLDLASRYVTEGEKDTVYALSAQLFSLLEEGESK